ncbi:MAG: hypothetical protein AAB316_17000 [Bacteroidota bacterium]
MTLNSLHWQQFTEAAAAFAQKWANEINEKAEAKSFWDGFFAIFGLDRYRLARRCAKRSGGVVSPQGAVGAAGASIGR